MAFEDLLDPILNPLLSLDPLYSVIVMSFIISLLITVIYKLTTNQDLMKRLKTEMKELQKEMKELREHPEKMMQVQKKAMETNMKYMMQSFKSTLYTLLPIILLFSWMNAHYAFMPIAPQEPFQMELSFARGTTGNVTAIVPLGITVVGDAVIPVVNDKAIFTFKGVAGSYLEGNSIKFEHRGKPAFKEVIINTGYEYTEKDKPIKNSELKTISIDYKKRIVLPVINWGWLGSYIIFSIVFSMSLRKIMKVY